MLIVSVSCKFVKSSAIQERILMPDFFLKKKKEITVEEQEEIRALRKIT